MEKLALIGGKGRAGGDEKAAEGGEQGAAGAGKPGSGMERRTGKGAGLLCPHRPGVLELLRLRYIEGLREDAVIRALYIGRTTYYTKELEVLSTVGIYAAQAGLLREE